ncbi:MULTISPECIES: endolytic transglycosylase MltG [unclassified Streptomyces]|uniref:endolytic transglycosylase MltG n=1 Tax=unclassified Streptomyces TaxID=2593676 RepID=UPI002DD99496|nr:MULTISPECIES: endolytic transglycosylase MltG [unclassified Streptomyces]WSA93937.1 endolytic transglycosylase MltG [Streptomyces sp. NBC_01795]WSB78363.1 endolytic transglycosylase MltG [Streptomyces sp. NBC_01775]WSS42223.1 endolytic transglycosylase MltG [Streptomyces sp. NBC_01187]
MTTKRKRWLAGATLLCAVSVAAGVLLFMEWQRNRTETLVVHQGWRATQVYEAADQALSVPDGTTKKAAARAARKGKLKLPAAAKENPEGYLYPSTYHVKDSTTPEALVTRMSKTAHNRLRAAGPTDYKTLVIASIVQAEAGNPQDMAKVARVIENRLKIDMPLQMDSSINYALGRSTLNTTRADTRIRSPYNTYRHKGLPPTPINNPGPEALKATKNPAKGDWLFFVTVKTGDTRFTADYKQHQKWVEEFNAEQRKNMEQRNGA